MLGTDEILKAADREPVFTPFLGGLVKQVLPASVTQDSLKLINQNLNLRPKPGSVQISYPILWRQAG